MPIKKPLTKKTKKKSASKKASVFLSVTKKLENTPLKHALKRRQKKTLAPGYFDTSIPQSLLPQTDTEQSSLSVRIEEHALSPFVMNLSRRVPTPQEILEEGARINLNFLEGYVPSPSATSVEPENNLLLNKMELASQLYEDVVIPKHSWNFSLPLFTPHKSVHPIGSLTRLCEEIPADAFTPKETPTDIFTYFDLPEEETEEEQEESDLVELNEIGFATSVATDVVSQTQRVGGWSRLFFQTEWARAVGVFVLISFVFVLPLHAMNLVSQLTQTKTQVEGASREGFSLLRAGADATVAQQTSGANSDFSRASAQFAKAQFTISELGVGTSILLSTLPIAQKKFRAGTTLLEVGQHLTTAGTRIAEAMDAIKHTVNPTPVSDIALLETYLGSLIPHLSQASEGLNSIDPKVIPTDEQETFAHIKKELPILIDSLKEFSALGDVAKNILGGDETKRYLLVFQNNTEIRPTGGFMGSFAEVKVRDGVLTQLSVPGGGTYDLQGSLKTARVAPEPLQLLSAKWEFQDANWFPDFPTSARQMLEFYSDAGQPSVDGVIAVNATFISKLIGLIGPIDMPEYGRTIDEENFLFEAQKIVETEYDKQENKPKAFIGDLAPKIIERVLAGNPELFLSLVDHMGTGLSQKDIQLYFTDDQLEQQVISHGWSGSVLPTSKDYLMVVDTNLGGGKTDGVIEEKIHLDVGIAQDGSMTNTVKISRTHHGIQGTMFTGVNNVDYLRLYVPRGSQLTEASGFSIPDARLFDTPSSEWITDDNLQFASVHQTRDEKNGTDIYEENGKTVFGNWVQTKPGATSEITFTYRLPLNMLEKSTTIADQLKKLMRLPQTQAYSLTLQKQSGVIDRQTTISVHTPANMQTMWQSQDLTKTIFPNETDAFFGLLLKTPL